MHGTHREAGVLLWNSHHSQDIRQYWTSHSEAMTQRRQKDSHCPLRTSAVQAQMTKHLPLLARLGNAASAQGPGPSFALEARLHFLGCAVRVAPAFRQPHALAETPVWTFLPNYLTQGKSHNAFFQHPYWDVHCSPRHTPILAASSSHPQPVCPCCVLRGFSGSQTSWHFCLLLLKTKTHKTASNHLFI